MPAVARGGREPPNLSASFYDSSSDGIRSKVPYLKALGVDIV